MKQMALHGRGTAALMPDDVLNIREAAARGVPNARQAERHRLAESTISNIVLGRTQAHVGGPIRTVKHLPPSSRFFGITFHKATGKWRAHLCCDGRQYHLAVCADEISAALVYNAEVIRRGLNRPLNIIKPEPSEPKLRRF
jgi:hypothetical protein